MRYSTNNSRAIAGALIGRGGGLAQKPRPIGRTDLIAGPAEPFTPNPRPPGGNVNRPSLAGPYVTPNLGPAVMAQGGVSPLAPNNDRWQGAHWDSPTLQLPWGPAEPLFPPQVAGVTARPPVARPGVVPPPVTPLSYMPVPRGRPAANGYMRLGQNYSSGGGASPYGGRGMQGSGGNAWSGGSNDAFSFSGGRPGVGRYGGPNPGPNDPDYGY